MAVGKEAVGVFQSPGCSLWLSLQTLLPTPRQHSISLPAKKAFGGPGEKEDGCPCGYVQDSAHEGYLGGAKGSLDQETSYLGACDLREGTTVAHICTPRQGKGAWSWQG